MIMVTFRVKEIAFQTIGQEQTRFRAQRRSRPRLSVTLKQQQSTTKTQSIAKTRFLKQLQLHHGRQKQACPTSNDHPRKIKTRGIASQSTLDFHPIEQLLAPTGARRSVGGLNGCKGVG